MQELLGTSANSHPKPSIHANPRGQEGEQLNWHSHLGRYDARTDHPRRALSLAICCGTVLNPWIVIKLTVGEKIRPSVRAPRHEVPG